MEAFMGIALLAPLIAILALTIKKDSPAFALLLCIVCGLLLLQWGLAGLVQMKQMWMQVIQNLPGGTVWAKPMLKSCGIAVLVRIGGELCRDAGEGSLAAKLELCGVVAVLLVASPLLQYLMEWMSNLW